MGWGITAKRGGLDDSVPLGHVGGAGRLEVSVPRVVAGIDQGYLEELVATAGCF